MKKISYYFFSMLLVLFVSCTTLQEKPAPRISLENFFKNSIARSFRISPNGQYIAALRPYKKRFNVFLRPMNGKEWTRLTSYKDRDISNISWKGNQSIIFSKDFGGDENFHVFSVHTKTKKVRDLTPFKNTKTYILDDLEGVSDKHLLITMNKRNKTLFDVYKVNVVTGKSILIEKNPGNFTQWTTDHTGVVRMAMSTDGVNKTLYFREKGQKKFQKVRTFNFKETFNPLFFDFNNKNIYAISNLESDTARIVLASPKTLKEIDSVYSNRKYDVSGLNYSKKDKELTTATYIGEKLQQHVFSSKYQTIYNSIKKQVPGKEIYLTSHNKDETLFSVYAGSDRSRGQYYIFDYNTKKVSHLLDPSPWLNENDMAEMKPISYRSRDGLHIEGYLTLPKGRRAKNLPLIVNPHGGPWARDVWGFRPTVQFLANRGYAVLQMNFRGSTGYGRKFWQASFKQWGQKMQDDVTDGVNHLAKKGIVDINKVCIYGASYGGYTTLAGLTYTPDLYKCGVDYVGVSNLLTFMKTIPPYWKPYLAMLHEMVGNPNIPAEKKMLKDYSPYYNAEKIKAPLFVAQGAKDPRVKKSESDQIVSALRKRGVKTKYMVKKNEGHGFRNEENRFEFYRAMEKFIGKHLL